MTTPLPPGQGPIDPRPAFSPPPPPDRPGSIPPPRQSSGFQPPMMPPPPWFPPPPPRRRSVLGTLYSVFATLLLVVSVMVNLYFLFESGLSSAFSSGGTVRETTLVDGDPKQKIVVVPIVNSMMLEAQADLLDKMLQNADKDANIKAIVLKIDTPGGAVTAADEMYHRILVYKTKHAGIPIVVTMGGYATSGGYYAACAGDYIFAQPTTLTGNIGVLLPNYNFSKLADKYGIEDATLHSTGATYKTAGSWLKPPTTQDTQYLTGIIDSAFAQFKSVVAAGRTGKLTAPMPEIANGKAYTAADALRLGLVDAIGYPPDAYAYAAKKVGLNNMTVVKYEQPATLIELLSSNSTLAPAKASGNLQINGVQIDAGNLDQLLTPRLLYLWRGN